MSPSGKQPSTWEEYERGGHRDSVSSTGSRVHWGDETSGSPSSGNHLAPPNHENGYDPELRRRRSSLSMRINSIRHAGGVNSFDNFARSWSRAAGFWEITPVRSHFQFDDDADVGEGPYQRQDVEARPGTSLLRAALQDGRRPSENVVEDDEGEPEEAVESRLMNTRRSIREDSIFSIEPSLASVFGGSYGTMYGSLASRVNESSMRHAARLFTEQQAKGVTEPDKEREPLLVKQIEEDGVKFNVVVGQSTLPQTIFNSVNVLIGVGLLSLPLAFKYSGWIIGILFFLSSVLITQYTAKLLAKCLDVDNSLITFADLAFVSFGPRARILTSILFSLELIAACVALIILFADSLDALIPGWDVLTWKLVCGVILVPLCFLPLRFLSFTSVLGILSCLGIVLAVLIDGLIKPHPPGSLLEPAKTHLFPEHWGTLPLAIGLMMSPWGGHSVFPNIYRDMRHPYKYRKGVNITYIFTFLLDISMAIIGILMFGDGVHDEITSNILLTPGYPKALSVFIVISIAIIPLTKVPLNARPIISTLEILLGLDTRALAQSQPLIGLSNWSRGALKITIRILTVAMFVLIAILLPAFDRIMTLLGSVCCFAICIVLPLAFHLRLFGHEMSGKERVGNWVLIVLCGAMSVVSTVFACLPKEIVWGL